MLKLMRNENMKIYPRLRTWILVGLVFVAVLLVAWVIHSKQHVDPNWKQSLVQQNIAAQHQLATDKHLPASAKDAIQQQVVINQYEIQHNLPPGYTAWSFASVAENLSGLVIAFIVVIAGDVVASEFSSGTIKMLLTQTVTRSRILLSKYFAAVLFALFMMASMLVLSVLVGGVFFGFGGADMPHIYANAHGSAAQMSAISYLLAQYGFLVIQAVMTVTIAFMVSAIFRSSALAITISILAYLVGDTLVRALSSYHWVKYILFANTDLSQYVFGGPTISGMTLGFSIGMLIAYFVVMLGLSWWIFVKRDVAYT